MQLAFLFTAATLSLCGAGCSGLGWAIYPTLGGELREEIETESDLWMEDDHPTTGEMQLFYQRPAQGDLWMRVEDSGAPPIDVDDSEASELPPRLERFLDLTVIPAQ